MTEATYTERIAFVVDLARHLHAYGTTSQRMEAAIESVARKLALECQPWCNPTGIILSFSDPARPAGESDTTRIIRPGLGDTNLRKLCEADRIAEDVINGRMGIGAGRAALRELDCPGGRRGQVMAALGFALASAAVAGLLRLPWLDIATACVIGLLIGGLAVAAQSRPRLHESFEALAGLLAGTVAILVSSFVGPLNLNTVIIAAVIVLLPGMTLALSTNELTSRHLVSGTARFAGALMTIVSLTIGIAIAFGAGRGGRHRPAGAGAAPAAGMGGVERAGAGCLCVRGAVPGRAPRLPAGDGRGHRGLSHLAFFRRMAWGPSPACSSPRWRRPPRAMRMRAGSSGPARWCACPASSSWCPAAFRCAG